MAKDTSDIADQKLIGLLGGTFDPVHRGHLAAAQLAREHLGLASVRLILSARPSHRVSPAASIEHRFKMLQIACAGSEGLIADDQEIRRQGASYTVVTLEQLHLRHPGRSFCWIVGSDAFLDLPSWHRWQRVFELAHLVVCQRVGHEIAFKAPAAVAGGSAVAALAPELAEVIRDRLCDQIPDSTSGGLLFLSDSLPDISATELRRRLARDEAVEDLLPPGVTTYIKSRGLYSRQVV